MDGENAKMTTSDHLVDPSTTLSNPTLSPSLILRYSRQGSDRRKPSQAADLDRVGRWDGKRSWSASQHSINRVLKRSLTRTPCTSPMQNDYPLMPSLCKTQKEMKNGERTHLGGAMALVPSFKLVPSYDHHRESEFDQTKRISNPSISLSWSPKSKISLLFKRVGFENRQENNIINSLSPKTTLLKHSYK
jgi:hypothetical protein